MTTGDENGNEANRRPPRREPAKLAEFLRERFRAPGMLRKIMLGFSWLILGIIGSLSGTWAYNDWLQSRHAIATSDEFAIATLAITFFAAVFALRAYQVSTGTPNLELWIMLHGQNPRKYYLVYARDSERDGKLAGWFKSPSEDHEFLWKDPDADDHTAYMWVKNKSKYPAKGRPGKARLLRRQGQLSSPRSGMADIRFTVNRTGGSPI